VCDRWNPGQIGGVGLCFYTHFFVCMQKRLEHLRKQSHKMIGGEFGEIFLATFRGERKVAVKKITRQESRGSSFSVQRETLREIWVLSLLRIQILFH
jgi:hypothetical protein